MVSAGEASGDMHAALALKALRQNGLEFTSFGLGGDKLSAQGTDLILHCRDVSVIGIFEVLIQYRQLLKKLNILRAALRAGKPDLLIIVDYPDFNLKLAETAKELGVPVLFYISPQVWAWREKRVHRIGSLITYMAVIFPFEVEFYQKANIPVRYVGHPLVDEVKCEFDQTQLRHEFNVQENEKVLGVLPGSRNGEVKRVLPTMLAVLDKLGSKHTNLKILLAHAPTLDDGLLSQLLAKHSGEIIIIKDRAYDVMQVSDAIMTASGTATLETAIMGTPMTIVYKVNPASYAIISRMIRIQNIGLVNIVAGKSIVREFVQKKAKPEAIARELSRLLSDKTYAENIRAELAVVKKKMGKGGASRNVADLIEEMLTKQ